MTEWERFKAVLCDLADWRLEMALLRRIIGRPDKRGQNRGPSAVKVRPPDPKPVETV